MKGTRPKIFIIGLTLLGISLSTSGHSGTLYRCVNSQGSIMLSNILLTDPDYKCTVAASFRDPTPQERAKEQIETDAYRQQMKAAEANRKAESIREEVNRKSETIQAEIRNKERELQEIIRRGAPKDLNAMQSWAIEAAAKKGEINRLQQQDPNYQPNPNSDVRR